MPFSARTRLLSALERVGIILVLAVICYPVFHFLWLIWRVLSGS